MIHTDWNTPINETTISLSQKMLAFIVLASCVTATIILSFMPAPLFLVLTTITCLGWAFHKPLLTFFGALKAEHSRDIQPSTNEQIVNFKQMKGFRKNSSLRALYGNAANHEDIGDDNVIKFPRSNPSN
jgi:hypothetical protein